MDIRLCLFLVLTLLAGCKKDDERHFPASRYNGTVSAARNGKIWTANIYSTDDTASGLKDRVGFVLDRYVMFDNDSFLAEELIFGNFQKLPYKADVQLAIRDSTREHMFSNKSELVIYDQYNGGDALISEYSIHMNEPHFIEVSNYDDATRELSGKFGISFLSKNTKDTIRFDNGIFNTKVK